MQKSPKPLKAAPPIPIRRINAPIPIVLIADLIPAGSALITLPDGQSAIVVRHPAMSDADFRAAVAAMEGGRQ